MIAVAPLENELAAPAPTLESWKNRIPANGPVVGALSVTVVPPFSVIGP
jgi:hypothetical protein